MAKEELDFLDKYCKTKKIERESYEPFCDLIVKLHDCNTSASTVFWRNVNNLNDMKTDPYKHLNITQNDKIEIIKAGFEHLIEGNGWITKTKVLSLYKNHPVFNIDSYPFFVTADNPHYKSSSPMKLYLVGMIEKFISIKFISLLVNEYGLNKQELENLDNEALLQIYNEKTAVIVDEETAKQNALKQKRKLDKIHDKEQFFQDNIERFLVSKYPVNNDNHSLPKRIFDCYLGNTNSGKTYTALEKVKQVLKDNPNAHIAYLAPLRLLALEIYEKMNSENIPCSLLTGEEEIIVSNAQIKSCTIEMLNENEHYDLIIVDEYQMYSDPQRGSAWYKTFINANCNHFILIGAENSLFGLVYLMNKLSGKNPVQSESKFANVFNKNILPFEPVFKIHYFKRICPITYHQSIELKDFQSGDCLVTFSKNKVLQYADLLKKLGYKVSILYGDLPLETRIAQSDNFKNGLTDVLVSTDVIGMGLNLPIKRLIFETMDKFDGVSNRSLTKDEFKQIAGRSGRYQQTGAVAYLNANELGYSPYYRCIVFKSKQNKALNLNFDIDYDFDDFDDIYIPSEAAYPLKRYIWDKKQIQSVLDEMNTSSEIMMELDNQEFTVTELLEKLSQSNYPCHQFTIGLNISLLEEYKNKFKLGFASAYKDYVNFITKELNSYLFTIKFKDNTLHNTLKHFNQIFKKNGFDCEVAIGLCQAPVNEDFEEEYMTILGMMFNQYSNDKLLQDWEKLGQISVDYAEDLYSIMQQSSINDSNLGILERMMIMNAWLHKKIKKISHIQDQNCESSEMIKDIRKKFAKEIQIKISQKLIADQLFTKCKTLFHKEYNDFELKMKPLHKEINQFDNKRGELKNKIKKAKKSKQYDKKKLYEKEMDDFLKQNQSHIDKVKNELDKLKKEQFNFINQKVIEELKKYY